MDLNTHRYHFMKHVLLLFFIFLSLTSVAQDLIEYNGEKINALDENARHTGIWKLYDEANGIVVTMEFKEGKRIAGPMYYKDSVLIAGIKDGRIEVYKDGKTIEGYVVRKPDSSEILVDGEGNEFDREILDYISVQIMPFFYGGTTELFNFIRNNIDQKLAKNNKGKVKVQFVIDTVGHTSQIEVIDSTNPELNEEAKRIIGILPRWQPGLQNGALVRTPYIIPLNFN